MESKCDSASERKEDKDQGRAITISTPDKFLSEEKQQAFLDGESRRPMKVATHYLGGSSKMGKGKNKFQPSSPTDNMMSPCSRKLMRKKSSIHDSKSEVDFEFWAPPPYVQLVLGSSSKVRSLIMQDLGWNFSTMSPNIDERAIEDKCQTGAMSVPVLIAKAKATAILNQLGACDKEDKQQQEGTTVVITSDQIVLFHNKVRGKPRDAEEAEAFLASYEDGEVCQTVTAVVATHVPSGRQASEVDICTVHWSGVPSEHMPTLLAKEDVMHSCGGFLIEDEDFLQCVHRIEGDMDSIRGLPVKATKRAIYQVLSSSERAQEEDEGI